MDLKKLEKEIVKLSVRRVILERKFNALAGAWCKEPLAEQRRLQKEFAVVEKELKQSVMPALEGAARDWVREVKRIRADAGTDSD